MVDLVKNNLELIKEACKKHKIKTLYLFGSATDENKFNTQSDVDFLYKIDIDNFPDWFTGDYDYLDNLLDFETTLSNILKRKVDLIPDMEIRNPYMRRSVEKNKQIVYAA